jgi:hypothetical protein
MVESPAPGAASLADLLATRRRQRFVGRAREIDLFTAALRSPDPNATILWVHGPGGTGKTTLLHAVADIAVESGRRVVWLDGAELGPRPDAVRAALLPHVEHAGRVVVLIDAYERLEDIDDRIRSDIFPELPADSLVVLAGRRPPGPGWRADPAWSDLVEVVPLGNLSPEECATYLDIVGVEQRRHERMTSLTHGHPLALSLLADVVARGADEWDDVLGPDTVSALVRRLIDVVPDSVQWRALAVCAISRVTTQSLLRHVLGGDGRASFDWLADLSFTEQAPEGVVPHELTREVLDADLRWRDPEQYRDVFRAVRSHVSGRLVAADPSDVRRAILDLKYMFRNLPGVLAPIDWGTWGSTDCRSAADDREAAVALIRSAEGDAAADLAEHWFDRQPDGFHVLAGANDGVRGVIGLLDLTAASPADRAADPAALAAWDHAHRIRPPRPGERVTLTRFIVDRDAYQGPSPTLNEVPVLTLQRYLRTPALAWDFLALHEPEQWDEFFALADLPRAVGADFTIDGRRHGLFGHDFRTVPVHDLIDLWTERSLAQDPTLQLMSRSEPLVMEQAAFFESVRQALRDLHHPHRLAQNPLMRTRLVQQRGEGSTGGAELVELVHQAVDALRAHPRDAKFLRAVDRTYLHPAANQESAAEALGLPFSTYRRHLTGGVERIGAWLWERELSTVMQGVVRRSEQD